MVADVGNRPCSERKAGGKVVEGGEVNEQSKRVL